MIVHDLTPAYAGVISHLLSIAATTRSRNGLSENNIKVAYLGDIDLKTPLANLVVSEPTRIQRYVPGVEAVDKVCLVSFSGCDRELLKSAGLDNGSTALLSLPQIWSLRGLASASGFQNFEEFVREYALSQDAVRELFEEHYEKNCQELEETSLFIADCVVAFFNVVSQFEKTKKGSLIQ